MLFNYANVFLFIILGLLMTLVLISVSKLLAPHKTGIPDKYISYECGERPVGSARILFNFRFYSVALAFLIFEIELVFIFPCVVIPFGPFLIISDLNVGVLYLLATGSFTVLGLIMAGWASNNKWSLLGGMRSAAQIVSYEVPNALAILVVVLSAGTMSLQGIIAAQGGGLFDWLVFSSPFSLVAFCIFFISAMAEINRIPFDIPEAESELVAGYNIEYSGMRFGAFFVAEFGNIYVISAVAVTCFLGGWQVPFVAHPSELAGAGLAVGRILAGLPAMLVISFLVLVNVFFAVITLRAFLQDLVRKWPRFRDRKVRINSEWLGLNLLFGGAALLLALHWPLRAYLPVIYELAFEYLLPFIVFFAKTMLICFVVLWWRWTLPRLRVDQLMSVCWRYLTPLGFCCLLGQAAWLCFVVA